MATRSAQPKKPSYKPVAISRWRINAVLMAAVSAIVIVTVRLGNLQIVQSAKLATMARNEIKQEITIPPRRGTIRDRAGNVLALDVDRESLYAVPRDINQQTAPRLALMLAGLLAFGTTLKWPGAGVLRAVLFTGASAPMFLLGILGLIVFYQKLGWVPANGRISVANPPFGPTGMLIVDGLLAGRFDVVTNALHHLILPASVIALGPAVAIGRVLRSSLLTDAESDYARTARAKGLSEGRIMVGHVLRNSVGGALSMTGLQVGLMFSGVLVIEQVFGWPGIGQHIAQSIPVADFPAIAGVTLMLGVLYVAINTAVDLLQAAADPRIAVGGG